MPPAKKLYITVLLHFLVWICLFFYPFLFHYLPLNDSHAIFRVLFFLLLVSSFFYANSHVLIPRVLGKKKILLYLVLSLIFLGLVATGSGYIQIWLNPTAKNAEWLFRRGINTGLVAGLLAWVISSAIRVTTEWFKNQQMIKTTANEKLKAELNFLKSQVNPHFLFNALNNIYALQSKNAPGTGEAILRLSELIRYMLYETGPDYVSLDKEIAYIRNYIELQKLGLSEQVKIDLQVTGETSGKNIRPMLLIPLVENMFKHGISYMGDSLLSMRIDITENALEIRTSNPYLDKGEQKENHGIGLDNLKKRLQLLYPSRHEFSATVANDRFETYLKINFS